MSLTLSCWPPQLPHPMRSMLTDLLGALEVVPAAGQVRVPTVLASTIERLCLELLVGPLGLVVAEHLVVQAVDLVGPADQNELSPVGGLDLVLLVPPHLAQPVRDLVE